MKYKVTETNGLNLLIKSDEENFKKELIATGKDSGDILENVIYLQTFGGNFKFYFLNEDRSEIKLVLENVDDYAMRNEYLLFKRGVDYFTIKESDSIEISLGSWFENGMFLNKTEVGVKVFYFTAGGLIEETYKSLCFRDEEYAVFESFTLSTNGKKQYSILGDLSELGVPCGYLRRIEDNNLYFNEDDIISLYARNDSSELFVKVYEGKSLIEFSNAVLERGEDGVYSLYGVENCQLVLWGQGNEAEWTGYHVILDNSLWDCDEEDNWLLVNNTSIIEDEPEPEVESEAEPKYDISVVKGPLRESLIVSIETAPAKKWWQFWK